MKFEKITFEEILPIWQNELWPETVRSSPIESTSAMCLFGRWVPDDVEEFRLEEPFYDLENMKFTPTFWGCFVDDQLVGVNSGHMCLDKQYRSRGLWVNPNYRRSGIAQKLLIKTATQGYLEGADLCWSYPRYESRHAYANVGFKNTFYGFNFIYEDSETGKNCRVIFFYDPDKEYSYEDPRRERPRHKV